MFEIGRLTRLDLGYEGESNARLIEICVADWLSDWPGATIGLLLQRPGEDDFYPAVTTVADRVLKYTPTRADVEIPGEGLAQIVMTDDNDVELRSRVVQTKIKESLPGSSADAPEAPMQPFVTQVLEAAARAEQAAKDAEEHKLDGFSPIVETSKIGKTTTVTITDAEGIKTATIEDGQDGKDGKTPVKGVDYFDGKDGDAGRAATIRIGTVTTLEPGSNATVTNTGTSTDAVLNFGIPKGEDGEVGSGGGGIITETDPTVSDWAKRPDPPTYTAQQVGADPAGTAAAAVAAHNADEEAHPAIREAVTELAGRLNALADSDDTTLDQLSEIVAYIKSNKSLIDGITTGKVSVSDIVNNLTSTATNKPLSAAQGKALKALIDAIVVPTKLSDLTGDATHRLVTDAEKAEWNAKSTFSGAYADLTGKPTIPTKVSQLDNDRGYLTEHQDISGLLPRTELDTAIDTALAEAKASGEFDGADGEDGKDGADYSFDPTVYGLPVLYLTGDISPIRESKDNKVTLTYIYGDRSGTCTLKGQGATSYKTAQALGEKGKYNYTINFDTAFEAADGWGAQKKYCLKANTIDHSHSRNVVSAKLWGMIVKSRTTANANLSGLVNGGAVDGFPVIVMVNDEFHGLYTWNIPKDGWMMGLVEDATKQQAIFGANDHETATQFKGLLAGDESDFELEFMSDEDNVEWVTTSLNRMIQSCIDSWGGDLDDVVGQYLDWDSVIDYYIFIVVIKGTDMVDKNYLLSTFDGTKWHFTAYDMDSTYGLNWDGSGLSRAVSNVTFEECATTHRAYELIKRFKTNALKARYKALRANVLSETRIMQQFENFAWAIPSPVLLEDVKRYPAAVHGSSVNTIDQIGRWVRQRLEAADAWMEALPAQETPVEPEQPVEMVNQVPISTDTDGSIYNGVGYKDNARLSSSGGVSSSAQTGSVVTGFIPYTFGDVIRMKGATWVGESISNTATHWYLNFYKPDKSFIEGVASSAYDTGTYGTGITYDAATGITTFDTSNLSEAFMNAIASAGYFRLNAKGSGADLVVTVNQEITD